MRNLNAGSVASLVCFALACAAPSPTPVMPGGDQLVPATQEQEWAEIQRLEQAAKGIVRTGQCAGASECRTAPVGNRGCGGPRYYLVYCPASTDTAALSRTLAQIVTLENAYNKKWQIISTCEYRMAPSLRLSGGRCEEGGGTPQPQ